MDLFTNPNLDLVRKHHAAHCIDLYNGYIFEPPGNGSLNGQVGYGLTMPIFGFNDYHLTGEVDEHNRSIILWCGGYVDMYRSLAAKTGLRLGFYALPTEWTISSSSRPMISFGLSFFPSPDRSLRRHAAYCGAVSSSQAVRTDQF